MTIRRVRQQIEALRQELTAPPALSEPSARQYIEGKLEKITAQLRREGIQTTPEARRVLVNWWRETVGKEISP